MKDQIQRVVFGMRKDSERRARKLSSKQEYRNPYNDISYSCDEAGIVIATTRSGCSVLLHDQVHEIALSAIRPGKDIVVGDRVVLTDTLAGKSIDSILPRKTSLGRSDPSIPERIRVIAANIDLVIAVVPAGKFGIRSKLVDRFLIAAQASGAQAVICVTKIDLLESESMEILHQSLNPYHQIDTASVLTSSVDGTGIADLQKHLIGRTSVMVGQSGVGKSSILNAMNPVLSIRVGEVRESDGKGKHTTTGSKAYRLDSETLVIDTPGIRQVGLVGVNSTDLSRYFPEFLGFDKVCRYSNCSHIHEPDCGVKMAVQDGVISVQRYESYRKLALELASVL